MFGLCGDAIDLFQRRDSGFDLFHTVDAETFHALLQRGLADVVEGGALADFVDHVVVGDQQFVDSDSSRVAEIAAARASLGTEEHLGIAGESLDLPLLVRRRLVLFLAILAELSHESLRKNSYNRSADE